MNNTYEEIKDIKYWFCFRYRKREKVFIIVKSFSFDNLSKS